MSYLNDEVMDQGLDYADTNGVRIDICSQEPTTFTEATITYTLGNATVNTGATEDGATDGRKVVVPAISSETPTADGTATHWALSNNASPGVLIAVGALSAPVAVLTSGVWNLAAFDV